MICHHCHDNCIEKFKCIVSFLLLPFTTAGYQVATWDRAKINVDRATMCPSSSLSMSMGHGLDRSDPSTHVDRSEILTRSGQNDKLILGLHSSRFW